VLEHAVTGPTERHEVVRVVREPAVLERDAVVDVERFVSYPQARVVHPPVDGRSRVCVKEGTILVEKEAFGQLSGNERDR
jgi:hypothetical protein